MSRDVVEEALYEIVARELECRDIVRGVMAKALVEALGDVSLARSLYIRLRVEQLGNDRLLVEQIKNEHRQSEEVEKLKRAEEERERQRVLLGHSLGRQFIEKNKSRQKAGCAS